LKTIDARFARAENKKTKIPKAKRLKNLNKPYQRCDKLGKLGVTKNIRKNFALLRETNSVNLQIS
jgi:hypothetical protein